MLSVTAEHAEAIRDFPELTRYDPFDRLIVAQGSRAGLRLLTADHVWPKARNASAGRCATNWPAKHSARRGDYRVIYRINTGEHRVEIVAIEHRADACRPR